MEWSYSCDEIDVVRVIMETLCNLLMLRLLDGAPFKVNFFCCHRMAEFAKNVFLEFESSFVIFLTIRERLVALLLVALIPQLH